MKDNTILWIVGIIIVAVLVLGKGNLGLFSIGYTSNEPTTLDNWETVLNSDEVYGTCDRQSEADSEIIICAESFAGGEITNFTITILPSKDLPIGPSCSGAINILLDDDPYTKPNLEFRRKNSFGVNEYWGLGDNMEKIGIEFCSKDDKFIIDLKEGLEQHYFNTFYVEEETCSNEPTTLEGYDSQLPCSYNTAGNLNCFINSTEFFVVKLLPSDFQSMGISNCEEYTEQWVGYEHKIATVFGFDIYKLTDALTFCNQNTNDLYIGFKVDDIDKLTPYFDKYYNCEEEPLVCTQDVKECPDGTYVGRNPDNNCEFYTCPEDEEKCLFTINEYCIKLWMLLAGIGIIILILLVRRK